MPGSREMLRRLLTFAGGSAVATGCSQLTLIVLYGGLGVAAGWSAVAAWFAGAVPNWWLGRRWTWRRRGRPDLVAEVLPYVTVVLVTLVLAVLGTRAADAWLRTRDVDDAARVALVAVTFLGVYVVAFLVRFWLLDRVFTRLERRDAERAGPA